MNTLSRRCRRLFELIDATAHRDPMAALKTILRGHTAPPPHPVKEALLRSYLRRYDLRLLLETGTFRGDMIARFVDEVEHIISIEVDRDLYQQQPNGSRTTRMS